ncbi:hypothetical protein SEA_SEMPERFI_58 [Mycobacterium phage SemperFi]|uniref:DUF6378 domain-containing protein n=1 Tax=Mycobacterium phage Georgie2 TaxID=2743928 RepID=A0A7D5FSU4_9CAUD|nr:phosphofructokinase [Mycobacterium phage SweetiePie]YP_010063864.1 phosphofructokinase [Mycobacterium phage Georgie2]AIT13531.1 hypothetical protein PBI_SWEETIEPIE_57 [Mycobacterium phage SweetiePie]QFG11858.1 hypothetical protein SEA_SEMPERFI_58 [Mycobacterium phage SemperFi]QLF82803.1 hypothetical protein SEA_GEORGIE2_58 [Mycobacterium phage Georgie2]
MSILTTAEEIINGQRALDYGDARENHERIAGLWNSYKRGTEFTPEDVAVMMILLKIARFMENGYHNDTVVDIAGYAGVLEKMQLPKEQRYPVRELRGFIDYDPEAPRQWDSLADVPTDVVVEDKDGDRYAFAGGSWFWTGRNRKLDEIEVTEVSPSFAPFTEVK